MRSTNPLAFRRSHSICVLSQNRGDCPKNRPNRSEVSRIPSLLYGFAFA